MGVFIAISETNVVQIAPPPPPPPPPTTTTTSPLAPHSAATIESAKVRKTSTSIKLVID